MSRAVRGMAGIGPGGAADRPPPAALRAGGLARRGKRPAVRTAGCPRAVRARLAPPGGRGEGRHAVRASRRAGRFAALLFLCLPAPGLAGPPAEGPLYGEWCNDLGDPVLYVEPRSLGIGEHRLCDWGEPPGAARQLETRVHCRRLEYRGMRPVVVDEQDYDFRAELDRDGVLRARFRDGPTVLSFTYSRCES